MAEQNGASSPFLELLRKEIADKGLDLQAKELEWEEARAVVIQAREEFRSFERILYQLDPSAKPVKGSAKRQRKTDSISPEKVEFILHHVFQMMADKDRIRQVDVRAETGQSSRETSLAFRVLRKEEIIRFIEKDGLSHYYGLTRKGQRARDEFLGAKA